MTDSKDNAIAQTPLMKQYLAIKAKYPDALLLFRVGDFYETFSKDAIIASQVLGIVLTKRKNGAAAHVELAGFPYHSLDLYLPKLVRAGYRVAICDQLEDPKLTKSIVKRGVTELVTPGVAYNDQVLDHRKNNFLAAVHFAQDEVGLALLDVSTGEFLTAQGQIPYVEKLIQTFKPSEVLYERKYELRFRETFGGKFSTFRLDDWVFTEEFAYDKLTAHFGTKSLKGFGVEGFRLGIVACGAALQYLSDTHHDKLSHIGKLSRIEEDHYVWLDRFTIRNLELLHPSSEGGASLLQIIDRTISPMGSRLMKRWLILPLKTKKHIIERHEAVAHFLAESANTEAICAEVEQIGDVERLISKVAVNRIHPRETLQLGRALKALVPIQKLLSQSKVDVLVQIAEQLNPCKSIIERIELEISEDAPALLQKGNVIRQGVNADLDELRALRHSGKNKLLEIQQDEIAKTGIASLKVAFNNVFGYYIEVRNSHKEKVPDRWIRKQTLVNAERYVTEELKVYEEKILGAEERIETLEAQLYQDLVLSIAGFIEAIQLNARRIAQLDCLLSFAKIAREYNYTKPQIDDSYVIDIKDGRHPVIEHFLPTGESYVTNDIYLDKTSQQIMMITGPNMAGKSALLRQTALIVILAQMGSYVPAKSARIGLIDKVFTRVGASDNISSGESTFMVEMNETASILNNISDRSLILLDEIGRGTSTYDGVSIAWAIAEFLHENSFGRPKTLFATHYHELNEMSTLYKRIKNYNVSVKEISDRVLFLRKLKPGGSEHSFGIHVAQMAGMPAQVVERAKEVLQRLERTHPEDLLGQTKDKKAKDSMQLSFFKLDDPLLEQIRDEISHLDVNALTPVEALLKLNEIKKMTGN